MSAIPEYAIPESESPEAARLRRGHWLVRKGRLGDPQLEADWLPTTPEQRLAMVWPLTVQAWALRGVNLAESRLPRHVARLTRRTR